MSKSSAIEVDEPEADGPELLSGYSTKKVASAVALTCVLHVVVLGAYFIFGSSKHPKMPATAEAKPGEEKGKKVDEKVKTPESAPDKTTVAPTDSKLGDAAKPDDKADAKKPAKSPEVASPNEIPARPDTDIDDILKRK